MTAQTAAQRQADRRARMLMLGMTEVRGVFLPQELHEELKEHAARMLRRYKPDSENGPEGVASVDDPG